MNKHKPLFVILFTTFVGLLIALIGHTKAMAQASKLIGTPAQSNTLLVPKWKVGVGVFYGLIPHYAGSNHFYQKTIPTPTFIYRFGGKKNLQGSRFNYRLSDQFQIGTTVGLQLPVEGEDLNSTKPNQADNPDTQLIQDKNYHRRGMENIGLLLKLGASFNYWLTPRLKLRLPIFLSTQPFNKFKYRGTEIAPQIIWRIFYSPNSWEFNLVSKVSWVDQQLADYFYTVKPSEALTDRPQYNAKAGEYERIYGFQFRYKHQERHRLFFQWYLRDYTHSANSQSSLHVSNSQPAIYLGYINYFYYSNKRTRVSINDR